MENKKKIFIAAEIFPPDIGGPATYSKIIADELYARGFKVALICYANETYRINEPYIKVSIKRSKLKFIHYFAYFFKLLLLSRNYDVIYAQGPVSSGLPAVFVKFLFRKKLVIKVVGDYAWEQSMQPEKIKGKKISEIKFIDDFQEIKPKGKINILQKIQHYTCRNADFVIVPSLYLKKIVEKWRIKEEKIKVIYNSINLKKLYGAKNRLDARRKLDFKENDFVIVSIGRNVIWKGFGMLAIVVSEIYEKYKNNLNIKLRILGVDGHDRVQQQIKLYNDTVVKEIRPTQDGGEAEILRVEHDKHYYKHFIDALGDKPKDDVYEFLLASDLFVLNTAYEGLSHAILEAFAFGVPVITTNVGGNSELVNDNYNGILIKFNNKDQLKEKIIRIIEDELFRNRLSENAKKFILEDKFKYETMINETINLFETL